MGLRLSRLPDRTPIKLSIAILPELSQRLEAYATHYAAAYGAAEPVIELVPAMLTAFLDSDRDFVRAERFGKPSSPD